MELLLHITGHRLTSNLSHSVKGGLKVKGSTSSKLCSAGVEPAPAICLATACGTGLARGWVRVGLKGAVSASSATSTCSCEPVISAILSLHSV